MSLAPLTSYLWTDFSSNLTSIFKVSVFPSRQLLSIRRIIPHQSISGPVQQTASFLMRLAWSSRIQLPVLIAVFFMTFDIRLQLEINVFWEQHHHHHHNHNVNPQEEIDIMERDDEDDSADTGSSDFEV